MFRLPLRQDGAQEDEAAAPASIRARRTRSVAIGLGVAAWVAAFTAGVTLQPRAAVVLAALPLAIVVVMRSRLDAAAVLTLYSLFLFIIPSQLVVAAVGSSGRPPVFIGIAGLLWIGTVVLLPGVPTAAGKQPLRIVLFAFFASVLLSYAAAFTRIIPDIEVRALDRGLILVLGSIGVALLAADGITTRERLDVLLRRMVWLTAFVAFVGLLQFFLDFDLAARIRFPGLVPNADLDGFGDQRSLFRRVSGTALHPIEFSVVLAVMLPLALHYAMVDSHRRLLARVLPLGLIGAAIPMAISRSGALAAAIVVLVLVPTWPRRIRRRAIFVGAVFIVGMRVLIPGLLGTVKALFTNIHLDPSTTGRTEDYAAVGTYIQQAPWFGRGFFTFIPSQYDFLDNQYLMSLIDSGLVGLAALIALFVVGICLARGARLRSHDLASRDLAQALAAALIAMAVISGTFDAFSFPMFTGLLFLLLGCTAALWRLSGGPDVPIPSRSPRMLSPQRGRWPGGQDMHVGW